MRFYRSHVIIAFLFISLLSLTTIFTLLHSSTPQVLGTYTSDIEISAFIGGKYRFSLFGYTSPQAKVNIFAIGLNEETFADNEGYFVFSNRFSPIIKQDLCLTSTDQLGRVSPPVCIPSPPSLDNAFIGPIILSPTISLNNSNFFMGDKVVLSGKAIPNSEVILSLFVDDTKTAEHALAMLSLVKPVEAITLPKITVKTDKNGDYSLGLPSSTPQYFRVFGQTTYNKSPSPRSNTLHFSILPDWMILLTYIKLFWESLKQHILEILILTIICLILYYLSKKYFHPHFMYQTRALVLRSVALAKEPESRMVVEEHELTLPERRIVIRSNYPLSQF